MTDRTDVLVVGGGPVGVFLAALLSAGGIDVRIWERRSAPPSGSRAIGIHAPSLDAFAAIGAAGPVLDAGVRVTRGIARSRGRTLGELRFARASETHPYVVTLDQHRTEAVLRDRLAPGILQGGHGLVGLHRRRDGVTAEATVDGGGATSLQAAFVVGADGAGSAVRRLTGIGRRGRDHPDAYLMGDFADPDAGWATDAAVIDVGSAGVVESFPLPGGRRRYVALLGTDETVPVRAGDAVDQVAAATLARAVRERTGVAPDPTTATMTSTFSVRTRLAERLGVGRVVLVGDAAHEISPIGGQGMNLGWLDAAALAPVLADAVRTGDGGPWPVLARRRAAAARRAAWQAERNMALGRPVSGRALLGREALLTAALRPPVADVLARAYAMRWA